MTHNQGKTGTVMKVREQIAQARRAGLLAALIPIAVIVLILATACSPTSGASVEFVIPTPTGSDSVAARFTDTDPQLGFVQGEQAIALLNGGRLPLGDDKIAEVFLAPYPPDWQTDLHLFLMTTDSFDPITDVEVDLEYDMTFMNHGIAAQVGTKMGEGHYILPLSFLMYGDWNVDTRINFPEGEQALRFIVKFNP